MKRLLLILMTALAWGRLGAQAPGANFNVTHLTGCAPLVDSFTDISTHNPTSWSWNFGNGAPVSMLQNPTTSYSSPGTYTVTLTATNAAGSSTTTRTITVNPAPAVSFTANDTMVCPGTTVNFTGNINFNNSTGSGVIIWNLNGSTASTANTSYTYNTPGAYAAALSAANTLGCTTTVFKPAYILVYQPPATTIGAAPATLCSAGGTTTLTATTTGTGPYTYAWTLGDGSTATGNPVTHAYAALGSYPVSVVTTDAHGCADTVSLGGGGINVVQLTPSFTGTTSLCIGALASFSNTTPGTTTASWAFGDGATGAGQGIGHAYATAGTYTVTMTVSIGGCTGTYAHNVLVNPKPVLSFTDTPAHPCPAPVAVQFLNTTSGAASYVWDFGDNTAAGSGFSPGHVYNASGIFDVVLIATTAAGCTDSLRKVAEIKIYPLDIGMTATPPGGCAPVTVQFHDTATYAFQNGPVLPYPYAITSRYWNFGDGYSSTAHNPTHIYTAYGTYTATVTLTTANGCTVSSPVVIHVGTKPTAAFTASPLTACVHQPILFTNQSGNGATDYKWYFGDGSNDIGTSPTHAYGMSGVYTVTLLAYNNGCADTLMKPNYITILDPLASFQPHYSCDTPTKVSFINNSVNYTSCYWAFGDGATSTATAPSHIYPALGTYQVMLITHNATTGCTDTMTQQVILIHLGVGFTATDTTICKNQTVVFTPLITGGSVVAYAWSVDNVFADTTQLLSHAFATPGYHSVMLAVQDAHQCYDTLTRPNYVLVGDPHAAWTALPTVGCAPATIHFTDATAYTNGTAAAVRAWSFGDGTFATGNSSPVTHLYPNAGTYDIKLVVTDNIGCKDSVTSPGGIQVHHVAADFTVASTTICAGVPAAFQNLSQGSTVNFWSFGDGGTSTQSSPQHAYAQPGTYTVKLVASDGTGCADSIVKTAYINVQGRPLASFTLSDTFSICAPLIVHATSAGAGVSQYAWTFGNGAVSALQNPVITYPSSGIFDVRLIVTNAAGCKDTAHRSVRILGYAGVLSYAPLTGCVPLTVTFTASNVSNVPGFIFDFGDGTTQASASPAVTHIYTQPGPHLPKLIMTDNAGCSSTSSGLDTIRTDGIIAGFTYTPYPACVSGTLTFTDTSRGAYSAITSHSWIFHDGSTASGVSATHAYGAPGNYNITLIAATAAGCKDTLRSSVTFWNLPVISAGPDTTICLTDSATLRPAGGVSYAWAPVATLSCAACVHPYAFPMVQTQYIVTGTDAHGCANKDSVLVKIKTKTTGHVGAGGEVCAGIPVQLSASGGNVYNWSPPAGLSSPDSAHATATPDTTTRYAVVIKEASCLADTQYVDVIIHPIPLLDAGPPQTIIAGNVAQLGATGSAYIAAWAWSPAVSLSCAACADPAATPKNTTTYTVVAKSDFNCAASDTVTVFVICDNSQVFIPNTFTPNGNGHNDKFYAHGKGITTIKNFRVYDRWGEVVFERNNINVNDEANGWDGFFKGKELPPDVYVYLMEAICDTGEESQWKGDVMLMR